MTNLLTNGGDYYIATIRGEVMSGRVVTDNKVCALANNNAVGGYFPNNNYGYRYQQNVISGSLADLQLSKVRRFFLIKKDGTVAVVDGYQVGSVLECKRLDVIMTVIFTSGELVVCKVGQKATRNFTKLELESLGFVNAIPKFTFEEQVLYDKIMQKKEPVTLSMKVIAKSLGVNPEDIQLTE